MRFFTLVAGLSTLLATSMASPAPFPAAEPAPVANAEPEVPYQTSGPLAGNLPINFAKVWVFDDLECNDTNGKTWMVNVLPGEDRCLPYTNVGSIFAWYKSDHG